MTRLVFFGTPREATPTLAALAHVFEVGLVVTRPDRPRGRSGAPVPSPVKTLALELGIDVAQPGMAQETESAITGHGSFDLGVAVAFGQILRPEVLVAPINGILNVHFSLLPRWRGAAPVARALMAGDTMTGVTIIRLDEGLDTGPVLTAQAVDVLPDESAGDLTDRLATIGPHLLVTAITGYLAGELIPVEQSDNGVTYAAKLQLEDRPLGQDDDPQVFLARVRGLAPRPGATLRLDGETHKILAARRGGQAPPPGSWWAEDGIPVVSVGGTAVALTVIQPPGGRPMSGADWVRGRHRQDGTVG